MTRPQPQALVEPARSGDRRALARLLTAVENRAEGADVALADLFTQSGNAHIVGITGAPGTGKSTLVAALTRQFRERGQTVAVLAVDPTSPFSGGAILGDRIRMRDVSGDEGVFIRSMATRGALGGLAAATLDCARVLDAAGYDLILIETVGAGQNEVAVARAAQTTVVVDAPGLGDEVQAIKAGILEIADILVVNKADRPGAAHTVRALRTVIETGHASSKTRWLHHGQWVESAAAPEAEISMWIPPILETVAADGTGIDALIEQITAHRAYLQTSPSRRQIERAQIELEMLDRLRERALENVLQHLPEGALEQAVGQVQMRKSDPGSAVITLFKQAQIASAT